MNDNNIAKLLFRLLTAYSVPITYRTIEKMLKTHPEYPSMQCISDALDGWKVKHVVLKLSLEKLRALDVPVIAHLKKGEYVWITQVTDSKVYYTTESNREIMEDCAGFEEKWSGVALVIEDITDVGESDYKEAHSKEIKERFLKYAFAGGFIVLLTMLSFFSWINDKAFSLLPKILLFFVNVTGCFISYLLIRQEKNQSNRLINRFCTAGAHIDCNKVTKSRYSTLFGLISWAEFGLAYFSAVILWLAIAPLNVNWLSPLWWLLLVPLPFTLWSLFTQAFLIRKWCLFCCAIVLLLWINAGMLYFFVPFICILPVVESALLVLLVLLCTAIVLYICKTSETGNKYAEQREMARIKYNDQTLQCHLSEPKLETANVGLAFGNPQARHAIILYVSIACSHCGSAVKELKRLTEIYPGFCCQLIFSVNSDDFENKANTITHHLLSLYKTMNKDAFFDMLDAWYTKLNNNLEALQKAYPIMSDQDCKAEMNAFYQFRQQTKISYTPAILINGRLLSKLYSYQDLFGIVRSLNAED